MDFSMYTCAKYIFILYNILFLCSISKCDFENARKISKEYRTGVYPRSLVQRFSVPDSKLSWSTEYEEYDPPSYTDPKLNGKPYADPEIGMCNFTPKWNNIDGNINRISYTSQYEIVSEFPRNPIGRTGLRGRGVLGRWGPNHAADCIVTRWKKMDNSSYNNEKSILQFVAIKRSDTGEWALPGGMVDPGETFSAAAFREFVEESLNYFKISKSERENWMSKLKDLFSAGNRIYSGYIDSPRNTDNAWIESTAFNFHDEAGFTTEALQLQAGDDAAGVKWMDVTPELNLYPAHKDCKCSFISSPEIKHTFLKLPVTINCHKQSNVGCGIWSVDGGELSLYVKSVR